MEEVIYFFFFVDDTFVFCESDESDIFNLICILLSF